MSKTKVSSADMLHKANSSIKRWEPGMRCHTMLLIIAAGLGPIRPMRPMRPWHGTAVCQSASLPPSTGHG